MAGYGNQKGYLLELMKSRLYCKDRLRLLLYV